MIRLVPFGLAALVTGCLVWSFMDMRAERDAALQKTVALSLALDGCHAASENIKQDKETDNAVDNLSDDDLRNVPNSWLRSPAPGGGGLY